MAQSKAIIRCHANDPEVLLCTQGTRGDIAPFLALVTMLKARGRTVTVLTNDNWRDMVVAAGADFLSSGPADPEQSGRNDWEFFHTYVLPSFRRTFNAVAAMMAAGRRPSVLFRSSMVGVAAAAERFDLTAGCVFLQPSAVISRARPPWPLTPFVSGRFGGVGRTVGLSLAFAMARRLNPFAKSVNTFRTSVGLPKRAKFASPPATFSLMACPDWFAMPQVDWPEHCYVTGFLFSPSVVPLPVDIAAFIKRHGPPLVFTPGTGVSALSEFVIRARETSLALGLPAVVLSPTAAPVKGEIGSEDPPMFFSDFVDLAALLPQSRALIHHGGIGTSAQAMRAGVPQLVVPDRFDQPDNAVRVAGLGLGAAMLRQHSSAKHWIAAMREIFGSQHIRQQLITAAGLLEPLDGVGRALAVMECFEHKACLLAYEAGRGESARPA